MISLALAPESPPLTEDITGAIRVGNSRVLLELVIRAFQDGASPETIVQRYSALSLSDVYSTIGYFLRHQEVIETYLVQREEKAEIVKELVESQQSEATLTRDRLLARQRAAGNDAKTAS